MIKIGSSSSFSQTQMVQESPKEAPVQKTPKHEPLVQARSPEFASSIATEKKLSNLAIEFNQRNKLDAMLVTAQIQPASVGQASPPVTTTPPNNVEESSKLRAELEASSEYQSLDPRIKEEINSAFIALENDPAGQKNLVELVRDPKFAYLISPDAESAAIAGLMQHASSSDHLKLTKDVVLDAAILEKNKNFEKLPEETKRAALNTMFYKTANGELLKREGSNGVSHLVTDPFFGKLTSKQQAQFLEIVRANPSSDPQFSLSGLMRDIDDMSPEVRTRAINIAHQNAMKASMTGNWKQNDQNYQALTYLLHDSAFLEADDSGKLAQLNGLSGQTGLEL